MEWKELARACRALAHHIDKAAEAQKGTSTHDKTLNEAKAFREYAERCELMSRASAARTPSVAPASGPPLLSVVAPLRGEPPT